MKTLDFYYDVVCPYAYLASTKLAELERATGVTAVWKPMLLGGVFQATGNRSPAEVPAKRPYMNADLKRFAARYGVPFRHNPNFPINTLLLMRGATGLQMREPERFRAYVDAVYHAMWVEPQNLNDPAVAATMLAAAGFDPSEVMGWVGDAEVKAALRATTEEAIARGAFGAPTMFVGAQMFFGQDRLDFVREALG